MKMCTNHPTKMVPMWLKIGHHGFSDLCGGGEWRHHPQDWPTIRQFSFFISHLWLDASTFDDPADPRDEHDQHLRAGYFKMSEQLCGKLAFWTSRAPKFHCFHFNMFTRHKIRSRIFDGRVSSHILAPCTIFTIKLDQRSSFSSKVTFFLLH